MEKALHSLDLVRALRKYVSRTASFRQTDAMFVLPAGHRKGLATSKSTITRWIRSTIQDAYRVRGKPIPAGLKAHSTRLKSQLTQAELSYSSVLDGMKKEISQLTEELHQRDTGMASCSCVAKDWERKIQAEKERADREASEHKVSLAALETLREENRQLTATLERQEPEVRLALDNLECENQRLQKELSQARRNLELVLHTRQTDIQSAVERYVCPPCPYPGIHGPFIPILVYMAPLMPIQVCMAPSSPSCIHGPPHPHPGIHGPPHPYPGMHGPLIPILIYMAPLIPILVYMAPLIPILVYMAPLIPILVYMVPPHPYPGMHGPFIPILIYMAPLIPILVYMAPLIPILVYMAPSSPSWYKWPPSSLFRRTQDLLDRHEDELKALNERLNDVSQRYEELRQTAGSKQEAAGVQQGSSRPSSLEHKSSELHKVDDGSAEDSCQELPLPPSSSLNTIASRFLQEEELRSQDLLQRLDSHIEELKQESQRTVQHFSNLK
ncbi:unnamed protein product [Ranitomeya imitator]|uniref:CEP63/Deup1 CEP152 binding coiled coil domain-containing protein n=1 Tax=Ranitomeya imitator TaxID=111125 RepID=A0ABN9L975_9NEOB|nr:unnamed protein product [Ranitomeya imitator]